MPLTVRLGPALDSALERYCAEHSVTKSLVVQESLATYLVQASRPAPVGSGQASGSVTRPAPSAAFQAFERAGLIGTGAAGGASADKAAVRKRITGA